MENTEYEENEEHEDCEEEDDEVGYEDGSETDADDASSWDEKGESDDVLGHDNGSEDDELSARDSPESDDSEEYGEFASSIQEIEEFNARQIDFSSRELNEAAASNFLEETLVDVAKVKAEVKAFLREKREYGDQMKEDGADTAKVWQMQHRLNQQGLALRRKCSLLSVGLTMNAIGEVADDWDHTIEDTANPDGGELRKSLREQMMKLKPTEREELLMVLWDKGRIDEDQYQAMVREFL